MMKRSITLPELMLIAGIRAAAGAGIGLLLSDKLPTEKRRTVGWTLVSVGALTTLPLLAQFLWGSNSECSKRSKSALPREEAEPAEAAT